MKNVKTIQRGRNGLVNGHVPGRRTWEKLARVAHFRPGELSDLSGVAPRRLRRVFLRTFGHSPRRWLSEERMLAVELRLAAGERMKDVAEAAGFAHTSNLCRWFKSQRHATTSQLRATVI